MRILFGTDNFYPNVNGSANFSYELAKRLASKGHEVSVIAPSTKFKHTIIKHSGMTIYGIPSVMIPKIIYPNGMRVPVITSPSRITEIVKEVNPQIIHIQDHFMICSRVVKVGKKLGIPLVGTNHFMPENVIHYFYAPKFAKKPLSKLAWRQFTAVYRHLNLITTPTKTAAGLIQNLGLNNPIIPVSCGVDLETFNPKNDGEYLKKRYEIASFKPVILYVGRLDKEKNIDTVIKAFSRVLSSIDAQLVIAGRGKEKTNLVNLSKELGIYESVTFAGFVPGKDLPFLYRIGDVFVIASIAELQSIATMEAMACGLPVIAANVMALPELVRSGRNGYLFNQADYKTLANQIIKILKNQGLKKSMSQNGLKIIRHHDINKTIKIYEDLYLKLL